VLAPADTSVTDEAAGTSKEADAEPDWPIKAPPTLGKAEVDAPASMAVGCELVAGRVAATVAAGLPDW
jgi:hypothetical protein